MPNVHFDESYSSLIDRLAIKEKDTDSGQPIYKNYYNLIIFLAMVGRHHHVNCDHGKIQGRKIHEVPDRLFETNNLDGYAYLLALDSTKDGEILRGNNDNEMWSYLEKYANLGMQIVDSWFSKEPHLNTVDILISQIKIEALNQVQTSEDNDNPGEINFS